MNYNPDISLIGIIEKFDGFYNNAWDKLLFTISIGGVIVGIIVPLIIGWYQRRFYKLEEGKIKEDIIIKTEKSLDKKFENETNALEAKIDNRLFELEGKVFHLQAQINYKNGDYFGATKSCLIALRSYVKSNDGGNLRISIESLSDIYLPKLNEGQIIQLEEDNYDFSNILDSICFLNI